MSRIRPKTKARIIRRAIEILSARGAWTQGTSARSKEGWHINPESPDAIQWCAIGAVAKATIELHRPSRAKMNVWDRVHAVQYELDQTVVENTNFYESTIVGYNDHFSRRKSQVLNVFEKTLARLEG